MPQQITQGRQLISTLTWVLIYGISTLSTKLVAKGKITTEDPLQKASRPSVLPRITSSFPSSLCPTMDNELISLVCSLQASVQGGSDNPIAGWEVRQHGAKSPTMQVKGRGKSPEHGPGDLGELRLGTPPRLIFPKLFVLICSDSRAYVNS